MRIKTIYILFTLAGLASLAACSDKRDDTPRVISDTAVIEVVGNIPESRTAIYDEPVTVGIDAAADGGATVDTRAVLSDDMRTVRWSIDDKVALWAKNKLGDNNIVGETFVYDYQSGDNEACFTGNPTAKEGDEFECVAVYPVPSRIDGHRVTYTLPDKQDGTYHSELDIMSSSVGRGILVPKKSDSSGGDNNSKSGMVHLTMHHLCHALRIRIPEGRNLQGKPVTRLLVEFPREVAGDISFEVSEESGAGSVTLTNGKRAIELDLSKTPFNASADSSPRYLWVFITAGAINGDISFTPLFEDGYCAETLSATVNRDFQGGHVTPINLTISAKEQPVTWIDFTVDYKQLGEAVNTLTVTAPENARFRGDKQSTSVSIGSDGKFSVGYYAKFYPDAFKGAKVDLVYDSTHAIVTGTATLPEKQVADSRNAVAVKAPYLFFEDFSLLQGYDIYGGNVSDKEQKGQVINDKFYTPGWTGCQTYGVAGKAIAIRVRHETRWSEYRGRVDSAPFSAIKDGKHTPVSVSFNYGSSKESGAASFSMNYGYTDTQGPIEAYKWYRPLVTVVESGNKVNPAINVSLSGDGSIDLINQSINDFIITECSNMTRLSWDCSSNSDNSKSKNAWLYIDNIRVSIAQ